MKASIALKSFKRSDTKQPVKAGDQVDGENSYIDELAKLGMVRLAAVQPQDLENKADPFADAGSRSPVLPAAQASRGKTAKRSGAGRKQGNAEA